MISAKGSVDLNFDVLSLAFAFHFISMGTELVGLCSGLCVLGHFFFEASLLDWLSSEWIFFVPSGQKFRGKTLSMIVPSNVLFTRNLEVGIGSFLEETYKVLM